MWKNYSLIVVALLAVLLVELSLISFELSDQQSISGQFDANSAMVYEPSLITPGGGEEHVLGLTPAVSATSTVESVADNNLETVKPAQPVTPPRSLADPLDIPVRAWLAVYVSPFGEHRVLTAKNPDTPYPIASLTKLLTAIVAEDSIDPEAVVVIDQSLEVLSPSADSVPEGVYTVAARDLLFPLLIESNNNAATALSSVVGEQKFVDLMNDKAIELGMSNTHFVNSHGLDPGGGLTPNQSTARALLHLAQIYFDGHQGLLNITKQEEFALWSVDKEVVRHFTSTNKLLDTNKWPAEVLGGKTGYTDLAGRNLLLVLRDNKSGGLIFAIVMGTNNHFAAMSDLLDWVYYNYHF